MRLAGTIVAVLLLLIGGVWTLQGANILAGSFMSGQGLWLTIGVLCLIAGLGVLVWVLTRRPRR